MLDILKEIDFFGKLPEFYIKGKQKQVTIFGRILTSLFIIIYIILIIYKLYRVFKRVDVTFYDSYSNTDETPIVHITKENFSTIFAIYNDSFLPYIDESIYYPVAYFNGEERKEIEIKRCDFDKIGSKYKKFFSISELNNYYCLNNIDFILKPYENSIIFELYPCKNTTENNNNCKPKELIEEFLHQKTFRTLFEDLLITPPDYENPVKERFNFLDCGIYINFGQYLYTEMQLVRIETSTNIIGFDFLSNPKVNEFIKFDNVEIIPVPGFNLNDESNENPISVIEFQLNDKILLEKRKYIQLIDVLGEVGGFMELIYSIFAFVSSLFGNIFYNKKVINSLFLFDTKRKLISIKKKDKPIFEMKNKENIENKKMNNQINLMSTIRKLNNVPELKDDNHDENYLDKINNINICKKSNSIDIFEINSNKNNSKYNNKNKSEYLSIINKKDKTEIIIKNKNALNIDNNLNCKDLFFSLCDCCTEKRSNIYYILINKSINITIEKLDIFNIFRNMCLIENINKNLKYDLGIIRISDEFLE